MITGRQIREARGVLDWTLLQLADAAGLHPFVLSRAEAADGEPPIGEAQEANIRGVLEAAGIEFTNHDQPGVRLRKQDPNP